MQCMLEVALPRQTNTLGLAGHREGHIQFLQVLGQSLHLLVFRRHLQLSKQLTGFFRQGRTALLAESKIIKGMADRAYDAASLSTAFRTEGLLA